MHLGDVDVEGGFSKGAKLLGEQHQVLAGGGVVDPFFEQEWRELFEKRIRFLDCVFRLSGRQLPLLAAQNFAQVEHRVGR